MLQRAPNILLPILQIVAQLARALGVSLERVPTSLIQPCVLVIMLTIVHQQDLLRIETRISIQNMDHPLLWKPALQAAQSRTMALQMVDTVVAEPEQVNTSSLQLPLHTVEVVIIHSRLASLHTVQSIIVETPLQVTIHKVQAPLRMVAVAVELVELRQQAVVLEIRLEHQLPGPPSHQQDSSIPAVMLQLAMEKSHSLQAANQKTASGSDGYPTQNLAHL